MLEKDSAFSRFASKISLKGFLLLCAAALLSLVLLVWGCVGLVGAIVGNEDEVTLFSEGLLAVRDDDEKWGYLNEKGDLKIECRFDTATPFNEKGRAVVSLGEEYFFIDKQGERVDEASYASVGEFAANGLARVTKKTADGAYKYGFINQKGKVVVDFLYDKADAFTESGYAAVKLGAYWGAIDEKGDTVLELRYADVTVSENEARFWVVNESGLLGLLDAKGKERIPFGVFADHEDFHEGLAAVCDEAGKWGFVNARGKQVIDCAFSLGTSGAPCFKNGYCGVYSAEKDAWSYIDRDGELIGDYLYSSILPFAENGLAGAATLDAEGEETWGFIDKKGRAKIAFQYEEVLNFNADGWATVVLDDKYAIINEKGKLLIAPSYEAIAPATLDGEHITAYPKEAEGCVQITKKGKVLRELPLYREAWTFADGFTFVRDMQGKYGILNSRGDVMVACTYDRISYQVDLYNEILIGASSWS